MICLLSGVHREQSLFWTRREMQEEQAQDQKESWALSAREQRSAGPGKAAGCTGAAGEEELPGGVRRSGVPFQTGRAQVLAQPERRAGAPEEIWWEMQCSQESRRRRPLGNRRVYLKSNRGRTCTERVSAGAVSYGSHKQALGSRAND